MGKILGFMVFDRGIESNQEKINVIQCMAPYKTSKESSGQIGVSPCLVVLLLGSERRACPFTRSSGKATNFLR
jgi:hypothetical protein